MSGGGNPNHDPKTGEFTSGDGGGIDLTKSESGRRLASAWMKSQTKLGSAAHAAGKSTGDHTSDKAVSGTGAVMKGKIYQPPLRGNMTVVNNQYRDKIYAARTKVLRSK